MSETHPLFKGYDRERDYQNQLERDKERSRLWIEQGRAEGAAQERERFLTGLREEIERLARKSAHDPICAAVCGYVSQLEAGAKAGTWPPPPAEDEGG